MVLLVIGSGFRKFLSKPFFLKREGIEHALLSDLERVHCGERILVASALGIFVSKRRNWWMDSLSGVERQTVGQTRHGRYISPRGLITGHCISVQTEEAFHCSELLLRFVYRFLRLLCRGRPGRRPMRKTWNILQVWLWPSATRPSFSCLRTHARTAKEEAFADHRCMERALCSMASRITPRTNVIAWFDPCGGKGKM